MGVNQLNYFVGKGKRRELRICGMTKSSHGYVEQTSVFQSSDLLLVSWVREQMLMVDNMVQVSMYVLEPDTDELWIPVSMREFKNMLAEFRQYESNRGSDFTN
jgi:hypothetical protein|tara:strand:- start:1152 stop:1460 length:309 start_codon:yes stop_codon:yes gene_type:complete